MKTIQLLYSMAGVDASAPLHPLPAQSKKAEEPKPYNIVYIMTISYTAKMTES